MRNESSPLHLAALLAGLAAAAPSLLGQGGLPPNAGQTIREGVSKPSLTGVVHGKGAGSAGGCLMRDASFALLGGNFGPSADGRRLIASRRGASIGPVTVLAWTPSRIEAQLSLGVEVEGETVALDLVDARGDPASLGGGVSFVVCFRDQTFLGGNLRLPSCSSERRQFRVVAEGPVRLERVVSVAPHAAAAPYGFAALAQGSWVVSASEVSLRPTPTPTPRGILPIGPPSRSFPVLPGCDGPSQGLDPRSRTVVISNAQRRATGVDFVEILASLPRLEPGDVSRVLGNLPTPTRTPAR
jgi:hypothetical protein